MPKKNLAWLVVAAGTVLAFIPVTHGQDGGQAPIYLDPKRPVEERIDDLMSRMTLKEKVGQLNLPCVYVNDLGRDIPSEDGGVQEIRGRNLHAGNRPGLRILHPGQ